MVKRMLTLSVVLAFSMALGCSTTQKWMAGGAAVGAAAGAGIGALSASGEAGEGALLGTFVGATACGLIGNIIEEKDIAAKIADYESQIAALKAENQKLKDENDALKKKIADLEAEIAKLKAEGGRMLKISLGADLLFKPGSARLSEPGKKALDEAASRIKSEYAGKFVMVEGHTDSDPIKASGWKSNWELGAARSLTVLHYLNDKGVAPESLSAATFSKYQPVASNDTKDGKAKNRRAVIAIYNNWEKPEVK